MFAKINVADVTAGAVRAAFLALALIAGTTSAHAQQAIARMRSRSPGKSST